MQKHACQKGPGGVFREAVGSGQSGVGKANRNPHLADKTRRSTQIRTGAFVQKDDDIGQDQETSSDRRETGTDIVVRGIIGSPIFL